MGMGTWQQAWRGDSEPAPYWQSSPDDVVPGSPRRGNRKTPGRGSGNVNVWGNVCVCMCMCVCVRERVQGGSRHLTSGLQLPSAAPTSYSDRPPAPQYFISSPRPAFHGSQG